MLHSTTATCLVLLPLSTATLPSPCCHRLLPRGLPCCHRLLKHFQVTAAMLFAPSCASSPILRYFLLHDADPVSLEKMNDCATLLPRLCPTPVILVPHFCHTLLPLCCQTSATLFSLLFATSFQFVCMLCSTLAYILRPSPSTQLTLFSQARAQKKHEFVVATCGLADFGLWQFEAQQLDWVDQRLLVWLSFFTAMSAGCFWGYFTKCIRMRGRSISHVKP